MTEVGTVSTFVTFVVHHQVEAVGGVHGAAGVRVRPARHENNAASVFDAAGGTEVKVKRSITEPKFKIPIKDLF